MDLLINLLIFAVAICLIWWILSLLPFPAGPIRLIVQVILVVIALVWLLSVLTGHFYIYSGHSSVRVYSP